MGATQSFQFSAASRAAGGRKSVELRIFTEKNPFLLVEAESLSLKRSIYHYPLSARARLGTFANKYSLHTQRLIAVGSRVTELENDDFTLTGVAASVFTSDTRSVNAISQEDVRTSC